MSDDVDDAGATAGGDAPVTPAAQPTTGKTDGAPAASAAAAEPDKGKGNKAARTLATGVEGATAPPLDWPTDWRERMAKERVSLVDEKDRQKAYTKELKRLERYTNPQAVWGKASELEEKLSEGGLIKVPGQKATDEERASFYKALGVPDDPSGYADKLKLSNNRVLGTNDKPVFDFFAERLHKLGVTPPQMSALTDAWLDYQQATVDTQEEADSDFRVVSEKALKKEWGGDFTATQNAIGLLVQDLKLGEIVDGGRNFAGRKIGDDPVFLKAIGTIARELYPADQHHGGSQSGTSQSRLDEIRALAREGKMTPALEKEQTALLEQNIAQSKRRGSRAA